ncbi:MAG TPA: small ribosomal subunit Rsm22 family protein [Myxococcales bacterium]|nr:small ribosomal subunit Rsm22 family protein [Myxococcales bacterium]
MSLDTYVPALLQRARALLGLPGGPSQELSQGELAPAARAVLELHEGLVGHRLLANPRTYQGARLGAYLLWWWPQTWVKVQAALRMVALPRAPRILDVGSGPGPAALAAVDALGGEATCFDASEAALAEARALGIRHTVRTLPAEPFDVVVAANVLSEVGNPIELVRKLAGTVVVVEPALRETGRALLRLRDALLEEGWSTLAPCLTQKPCPALASPKDWCTAEVRWSPPAYFLQLCRATGLRADEMISFAPLIVSRSAPLQPPMDTWRVVGAPPPEKGKKRLWICSDEGRLPLVRLDRHAAAENAAFDELRRGDLVRVRGSERRGDGLRVGPGSSVESP